MKVQLGKIMQHPVHERCTGEIALEYLKKGVALAGYGPVMQWKHLRRSTEAWRYCERCGSRTRVRLVPTNPDGDA